MGFMKSSGAAPGCEDIDECSVENGGCDMLNKCLNLIPGRKCGGCPGGYINVYSVDYNELNGGNSTCVPLTVSSTLAKVEESTDEHTEMDLAEGTPAPATVEPLQPEVA